MKKAKKLLVVLTMSMLVIVLVSGCASKTTSDQPADEKKIETEVKTEPEKESPYTNKASDEEIAKVCAETQAEYATLPAPTTITSPDEYLVHYKKYVDLYVKITDFYAENILSPQVQQTHFSITGSMPDWVSHGNQLANSYGETADAYKKASAFFVEAKDNIGRMNASLENLVSKLEELEG